MNDCIVFRDYDEAVESICKDREHYVFDPERDFKRKRKLPMDRVIKLLVSAGAGSTKNVIDDFFDGETCGDVPYQSSLTEQRRKLRPTAFEDLFRNLTVKAIERLPRLNIRPYVIDGVDFVYESSPAMSDEKYFHKGEHGGHYEQDVTAMYDLEADRYIDAIVSGVADASEPSDMCTLVDRTKPRACEILLFLMDRGFCSYNDLAHLQESRQFFLVRDKDILSNGIAAGLDLPDEEFDIDIEIRLGTNLPVDKKLPKGKYNRNLQPHQRFDYFELTPENNKTYTLYLRVVRFKLSSGEWETVFTNLPREMFDAEDVKKEYAKRWGEEVSFRDLKYTLGALSFHARIDYLVTQSC